MSLFLCCIYLEKLRLYNFARLGIIIISDISIFYYACKLGEKSGAQLVLIAMIILPLVLYQLEQKFYMTLCVGFSFLCFVVLEYTQYSIFNPIDLSPYYQKMIFYIMLSTDISVLSLVIGAYISANKQYELKLSTALKASKSAHKKTKGNLIKSHHIQEKLSHQASYATLTKSIAHELNNPLQIITMGVDVLEQNQTDRAFINEYIENSRAVISRLNKTLRSMLNYGKLGAEKKEGVDVNSILNTVINLALGALHKRRITVEKQFGELPPIFAAANELQQVFTNLILNAIEAVGEKGGFTVSTDPISSWRAPGALPIPGVRIAISDTGPGISEEDEKSIFAPFYSKKYGNAGLGLSVCLNIVTLHGGRIFVDRKRGTGACFVVELPCRKENGLQKTPERAVQTGMEV